MSLAVLITKNCLCSSTIGVLPKIQSSPIQPMHCIFIRLAGRCSSRVVRTNNAHLSDNIPNKLVALDTRTLRLLSTSVPVLSDQKSSVYKPKVEYEVVQPERDENPSELKKTVRNIFVNKLSYLTSKSLQKASGYTLYQLLVNHVKFKDFFTTYSMPDTFNSWFVVMELHVWMLSVRLMAEGPKGKAVRNNLVEALWEDVKTRAKGITTLSQLKEGAHMLATQFTAAFVGYDEGLLTNDQVLASAVWRRFFRKECVDPHLVESLVSFIRKQVHLLDQLTHEDIIDKQKLILLRIAKDPPKA